MKRETCDVVVVGSGPGGATVSRELARAGKRVILLERGRDWRGHRLFGTYLGAMLYSDKMGLLYSEEGLNIIRPLLLGGATSMYCGSAAPPPPWFKEKYGVDIDHYVAETMDELPLAPLPPEQRGEASTRIAAAAADLGLNWEPLLKFIFPQRTANFDCGAHCMLGCRCGAKWNAAEFVEQAMVAGCELWTQAKVDRVLASDGQAIGVSGKVSGKPFTVTAGRVVLAAGGIGTARILQETGLAGAGQGMTMDTTVMVYGHAPYKGIGEEPPMTWSFEDEALGVMYSTLIDPWLVYPLIMVTKGPAYSLTWHRWGRTLGVMIKLKDEISGGVDANGRIRKGLTPADRERLAQAEVTAAAILRQAGCNPDTIFTTPLRGTHPSGTVRLGEMLSVDLESEIKNLYVCDASTFPEALARPTVLTIIGLARRLAVHLTVTAPQMSRS
jgi:choline dehydrogenase-like flavoprotein